MFIYKGLFYRIGSITRYLCVAIIAGTRLLRFETRFFYVFLVVLIVSSIILRAIDGSHIKKLEKALNEIQKDTQPPPR